MSKNNIIHSDRIWISYVASLKLSLPPPAFTDVILFVSSASYIVYLQFGNNTFKCHWKWLTTEMFSLPETPKVGGNHFGLVCLRASAWNFHGEVDENSMKIWLWVTHLWIRWILTGNKNTGESWEKRCWTLGLFISSCKRRFLLGRVKRYTHTEMGSCVNNTGWFLFHLHSFIIAVHCLWTLKGNLYFDKM